jgi:hypothetical protein
LAPAILNWPRVAACTDGTPPTFLVLGVASVANYPDAHNAGDASVATMGVYTQNGTVFTCATTDWARVLLAGNKQVDQITRNVLDRLRSRAVRIVGLGGPCSQTPPVEGAQITLHVGTLPGKNASFTWTLSAGAANSLNQPSLTLTLPSPPVPVTVTVTIDDATDCLAFGTLTFVPMTQAEYRYLQIICRFREFITTMYRFKRPPYEPNTGVPIPLWDPLRGIVGEKLSPKRLQRLASIAREFSDLVGRILPSERDRG